MQGMVRTKAVVGYYNPECSSEDIIFLQKAVAAVASGGTSMITLPERMRIEVLRADFRSRICTR